MAGERTHRKHDPLGDTQLDDGTAGELDAAMRSGGQPLTGDVRRSMEDQFGTDLSSVRVHDDGAADRLAGQMSARAFTVGSDIFFRQGSYAPKQDAGKHVLAHELTHVVQRHTDVGGGAGGMTIGRADAPEEVAAEQSAANVVKGLRASAAPAEAQPAGDSQASGIARMTECGCGNHTIRRDDTTTTPARRPRPRGINLGSGRSGGSRPRGINLGSGFDASQLGTDDDADTADTTTTGTAPTTASGPAPEPQTLEKFLESMGDPAKNTVLHNIPSSGMGRFDAQYLPQANKLIVTVRPRFEFKGTSWTDSKKKTFIQTFSKQAQQTWSGKYAFVCTKVGFESLKAKIQVLVAPVTAPTDDSHVNLVISDEEQAKQGVVTGIDRNQDNGGAARNQGNFKAEDAPVRPHDNVGTRCQLAQHDSARIEGFLSEHLPNKDGHGRSIVTADAHGINDLDKATLAKLVALLNHATELKAVPVPIVITYHEAKGDKTAKKRAEAVSKALGGIKKNPIKVRPAQADVDALKKAQAKEQALYAKDDKAGMDEKRGYRKGGYLDQEAQKEIDKHEGLLSSTNITIGPDRDWVKNYKDSDPYSILAHEFGHMLGNPDEYFGYGAAYLALKKEQLDASGVDADTVASKNLKQGAVADGTATIQENWGKLVKSTGSVLPSMTTKGAGATNSIMNAGAVVMPAHYATLLEALGRITSQATPAIAQTEWTFK